MTSSCFEQEYLCHFTDAGEGMFTADLVDGSLGQHELLWLKGNWEVTGSRSAP